MFKISVAVLVVSLCGASYAETLKVQMDCKGGICVPTQQNNVDVVRVQKQIASVKKKLEKVEQAVGLVDDVSNLKKQVGEIQDELKGLKNANGASKSDVVGLEDRLGKVERKIVWESNRAIVFELALNSKIDNLEKSMNKKMDNRKNNLQLGTYGLFSSPFENMVGLMLTLDVPMGDEGKWHSLLTGGLGLSPSVNLGFLTSFGVERNLGKRFSIGPIALLFGDLKNMMGEKVNWVAAGGLSARVRFDDFNISLSPFLGMGPNDNVILSGTTVTKQTTCGLVSETTTKDAVVREMSIQAGALLTLGYSLF
ncbi:MAG: hypothetical protein Q8P81_01530 [Nanoarchaeota archaeon]|nr:hypothetical protein [Nanoarchaeota archaeon]